MLTRALTVAAVILPLVTAGAQQRAATPAAGAVEVRSSVVRPEGEVRKTAGQSAVTDSLAMPIDAADSTHASDASWQAAMNSGWLEWVSPLYARDHSANDSFAQAIEAGGGATVGEFQNILNRYFNSRSSWSGGDATGFVSAANFFRVFGIAAAGGCGVGLCSRTHGLASDGANGIHDASGQILVGHIGYFIVGHPRADGSNDTEIGSSLVHQGALAVTATPAAATVTPEPATITLTASGLIGLAGFARRRRKKAAVQAAV